MPNLSFNYDEDESDPRVGLELENNGPGTAIIRSLTFYVDGKPVKDSDAAVDASKLDPDVVLGEDFDKGDSLAVGERVWLFSQSTTKKKGLDRLIDFVDGHLSVKVVYCSIAGDCVTHCSSPGKCQ